MKQNTAVNGIYALRSSIDNGLDSDGDATPAQGTHHRKYCRGAITRLSSPVMNSPGDYLCYLYGCFMRVAEHVILSALRQGGCIKSFYRISARQAVASPERLADGYCLETPGASGDTLLNDTDFRSVEHYLKRAESWEQTVGALCFGGATWLLRSDAAIIES